MQADTETTIEIIEEKKNNIHQVRISVRTLVEFLFRSGDIDNRFGSVASTAAMNEGTRIHKKIQAMGGASYRSEVSLETEVTRSRYQIVVEGRADGIFEISMDEFASKLDEIIKIPDDFSANDLSEDGRELPATPGFDYRTYPKYLIMIDEIKGVYRDVTLMEEPVLVHLAQAKCYAYIVASQENLDFIGVQMTYCDMDTDTIKRFIEVYSREEIEHWFDDLIDEYAKWADMEYDHMLLRDASVSQYEFPYEYREGQKKLCQDVYKTITLRKNLFIQAPTGTGKTLSVMFPAVKAFSTKLAQKIFYVTAKTITASVALDTARLFHDGECHMSAVQIVAKEKMCILDSPACNPDDCPYARGHFDRINDALYDILTSEELCTREVIAEHAAKYEVCPFELSLDISTFSDVIIGDYNYVFDPSVKLKRFFAQGLKGDYIFLVDEGHNLPDRAREMYSATIVKEDVLACLKRVKKFSKRCERTLTKLNRVMLDYKRDCENLTEYSQVDDFYLALSNAYEALRSLMEKRIHFDEREEVALFYFDVMNWLQFYEERNEKYLIYTMLSEDSFSIKIFCANPSSKLQECLDQARSTIFFSGTFLPIDYYKNLLSTKTDNYAVYANSIFESSQRLLLIGRDITSKYTSRGPETYEKVARYIITMASGKQGNYMAFFPSYAFMDSVYQVFLHMYDEVTTDVIIQEKNMREESREEFLRAFQETNEKTLIGFCVLGGIFSEGIDLANDSLIGAAIIGTGLGGIDPEQELLKSYFDRAGMNGFDYVYRYPGMNRVAQAAGRVIRTVDDKGVILLLDDRFLQRDNTSLFPREWSDARTVTIDKLSGEINSFWNIVG